MSAPTILFYIGSFPVHLFGVMIALGIATGMYVVVRECEAIGLNREKVLDLILYVVVGGVVGARVLYVMLNFSDYRQNPLSIFAVHQGGLAFHGAVFAGVIIGVVFTRVNRLSFSTLADLFAPGLAIGYAIGRIGCDIYGNVTTVPWAVYVNGVGRHPVQFYSAFAGFVIFALLWTRRKSQRFSGEIFLLFIALYSIYRFFVEFFRSAGGFTPAQYLSLIAVAMSGLVLAIKYRRLSVSATYNH